MNRISTLILAVVTLLAISADSQTVYVNYGTSTNYTLYSGDSLYIANGTYTGTISNWQQGAKIAVAAGASFKPNNFGYFLGRIYIYGNATLGSINGQTSSFRLVNYGNLTVTGDTYLGSSATIENNYGSTITFTGGVNINSSNLVNNGTITINDDFYAGNSSSITNNDLFTAVGDLQVNGSAVVNGGMFYTKKKLTLSNSTLANNCRTIADGSIQFSGSTVTNNGLLWASNAKNNSVITNSSTITSMINGKIKSTNFSNSGTLNGTGFLYFTGTTTNSGVVGKSGVTSDSLKIYDGSRTNGNSIFDNQNGTVYNNVKYASFTAPDTTYAYPSCAIQYASMMATLPVKWNAFYVNLSDNVPVINWSAEQEAGTVFEVQRSYDGSTYTSINVEAAVAGITEYHYDDRAVNTQASIVYYRVRAIELSGAEKFTETKTVRFNLQKGIAVQTSPNPFTSQFSLSIQSDVKTVATIRIFTLGGQLQATKSVNVGKGLNTIAITEAASFARGIYVIQLTDGNGLVASEKVVKQ